MLRRARRGALAAWPIDERKGSFMLDDLPAPHAIDLVSVLTELIAVLRNEDGLISDSAATNEDLDWLEKKSGRRCHPRSGLCSYT